MNILKGSEVMKKSNKVYTHRGYVIILNTENHEQDKTKKWIGIDGNTFYGKSIDNVKYQIDKYLGGYATDKIPKRLWKEKEYNQS